MRAVDIIQKKKEGKAHTKEEIDYCVQSLVKIVHDLRELSPLFLIKKGENKYV